MICHCLYRKQQHRRNVKLVTGHRWTNRGIGAFSVIGDWRSPNITLIIGYRVVLTLAALTNFLFRNLEIYFQEKLGHL